MKNRNFLRRIFTAVSSHLKLKLVVVPGFFAILPFLVSPSIAGEVVILSILILGYNLLLGYGGEMSFGHAAYFGIGAYGMVLSVGQLGVHPYVGMFVGIVGATVVSAVFGRISLYRRGIYFAMITLALAQMVYFVAFNFNNITGGQNGAYLPVVSGAIGPLDPFAGGLEFYVFALIILAIVWIALYRVVDSPYGLVLIAVRESEERAEHLGYDADRVLLLSFVMSGMVAGLAGTLHVMLFTFIAPATLFWSSSGEIVLMAVMGGVGTLVGPVVGAAAFVLISNELSQITSNWPAIFGALFVLIVIFAPQGIYGLYQRFMNGDLDTGYDLGRLLRNLRP